MPVGERIVWFADWQSVCLRVEEWKIQLSNRQRGALPAISEIEGKSGHPKEKFDGCSVDVVVAQLTIPTEEGQLELTVCSAYFSGDIGAENLHILVKKLVRHCRRNNKQLIGGAMQTQTIPSREVQT
ncbi:hypothetical protein JTB14_005685 [Gonioctena quinquepunctata]|nr:hypothetical protein JTB14_005685 [Gonioctena quinquepunctata]